MSLSSVPIVGRKYALISKLGQGAMADVYLGLSEGVQGFAKLAVVKLLRSHLTQDPDFLARFLEEGRLSMRLAHPNIVQTYEVGQDGNSYFMAMEFLQGQSLASILNRCGLQNEKFDFACMAYVLTEVLAAMEYAHELADYDGTPLRVVHRDLSPPNLFVTYDGQVKVLDFGIAKALDSAVETKTGIILGKTRYMSPEQALGEELDCRTDLYAIGVMLWEAAAGRRRWAGLTDPEIVRELVTNEFVELPGSAERGLPPAVDDILSRALAPDRDDRYHSAAEFRSDLEGVLREFGPQMDGRQVGKIVAEQFTSERTRLEREVQLKVGKLDDGRVGSRAARIDTSTDPLGVVHGADDSTSIAPITTGAGRVGSTLSRRFRRPAAVRAVAATFLISTLAAGIGYQVLDAQRDPVAAVDPAPRITLRVSASPERAVLYLDGARLSGNPAIVERTLDLHSHELRADAEGHRAEVRAISLSRDLEVHLQLRKDQDQTPPEAAKAVPANPVAVAPPRAPIETKLARLVAPSESKRSVPVGRATFPASPPPPPPTAMTTAPAAAAQPARVKLDTTNPWR